MDKTQILRLIRREAAMVWDALCETYPALVFVDPPKLELNPYVWRTAGQCFQDENRVQLGMKFFRERKNFNTMIDVILPHEIIHQADFVLHGESEKPCGHGAKWCEMMLEYGLPANPYHNMDIPRK